MSNSSKVDISAVSELANSFESACNQFCGGIVLCSSCSAFSNLASAGFNTTCCSEYDTSIQILIDGLTSIIGNLNGYIEGCYQTDVSTEHEMDEITEEIILEDESEIVEDILLDDEESAMDTVNGDIDELNNGVESTEENLGDLNVEKENLENPNQGEEAKEETLNELKEGEKVELEDPNQKEEAKEETLNELKEGEKVELEDQNDSSKTEETTIQTRKIGNNYNSMVDDFIEHVNNMKTDEKKELLLDLNSFINENGITIYEFFNNSNYDDELIDILLKNNIPINKLVLNNSNSVNEIKKYLYDRFIQKNTDGYMA